ncbi:DNA-directed DNA polymerase [Synchytrium endobioticum]|uniref:DNA-directed DNA polymerase n=1 Tax=Synchytrium endobioticum TaxID=286115 RepID=A0A507DC10_9FUNG|nr:DNA-directed DNA polymerase [Synchytrium endobioticum]TPX48921.1 DNA-directed DNA polymerase [Synchytrium endobioticum]
MTLDSDVVMTMTTDRLDPDQTLQRRQASYTSQDGLYRIAERSYSQQYAGLYFSRLSMLAPRVKRAAQHKWSQSAPNALFVDKVLDVEPNQPSWVLGTLYKDMPLKPNILDEVAADYWVGVPPPREKYTSDKDKVVVEDYSGRLRLRLTAAMMSSCIWITGVIAAVLGTLTADGEFEVVDVTFAGADAPAPIPVRPPDSRRNLMALVSGISLGDAATSPTMLRMMIDFLTGELGEIADQVTNADISRVIIAGNSIIRPKTSEEEPRGKKNALDNAAVNAVFDAISTLDELLAELCDTVAVDLMPGKTDPTTSALPQQPMHAAVVRNASRCSTFSSCTNPHSFVIEGVSVLGTSGENLDDIYRFVESKERMAMTESFLSWGHIAPTCPDTLWCFPYKSEDPFVIQCRPHVFFIGNQPRFETKLVQGPSGQSTRIVLLPWFASTGTIALVDLDTLECFPVCFGV